MFCVSRTIEDKASNSGRIFIAKNRNGPDGMVYPIFMDTSLVKIKVFQQSEESVQEIVTNAAKHQHEKVVVNAKEKYKQWKKQASSTGEN